jgi:hypothetical protein
MVGWLLVVAACDAGGFVFRAPTTVARAEGRRLAVDRLAAVLSSSRSLPLTRDVAERVAHRWVEYTLFAVRLARGDSLLDGAMVERAMWPELDQQVVEELHSRVLAERLRFDSATADSVYAVGEHRLIEHLLVATRPDMTPAERQAAERKARRIRAQVAAGGSWARANEESDDTGARLRGGSLGVIARGQMVPEFEAVVFTLAPGALSDVFETPFGFHVARRPRLDAVRAEFAEGARAALGDRVTRQWLDELTRAWQVEVRSDAPAAMRDAAGSPLRAIGSSRVIGSYRGGAFAVGDFVRWLQVMQPSQQQQVGSAGDDALLSVARSMIRNEVLVREARQAGIRISDEALAEARRHLGGEVAVVRRALGLDSAFASAASERDRVRAAGDAADRYVGRFATTVADVVVVPAFLADALREDADWVVVERAIDVVIERARAAPPGGAPR